MHTIYKNIYILYPRGYISNWFMFVHIGVVIIIVFELKYVIKYVNFILIKKYILFEYTCIMACIDNGWFYKPNTCCIFLKRSNTWSFRILNHFLWNEIFIDRDFFTCIRKCTRTWVMVIRFGIIISSMYQCINVVGFFNTNRSLQLTLIQSWSASMEGKNYLLALIIVKERR